MQEVYKVDWYRVPLPAAELETLNRSSDCRGFLQAAGHTLLMLLTAAAAIAAWKSASWGWLLLALYLHGTVCAFMINAVHELVHGTVFRARWLNQLFVHFFAFIGWINHYAYWASHSEHHKFTLHAQHDGEVALPVRFRFREFLAAFTLDPLKLWTVVHESLRLSIVKIDDPWLRQVLEGQQRRFPVFRWARAMVAGHFAIAVISLWQGWWIIPVVVSMTPMYGRGLFSLLNNTQHVGLSGNANDFRLNSRSIAINPLFRFLYWNMNFHIEHHMYAAVPCYRLPALSRRIASDLPAPPRGVVAAWYEIIAILYRQSREPGYTSIPELPGQSRSTPPAVGQQARDAVPAQVNSATPPSVAAVDQTAGATGETGDRAWQCRICGFTYYQSRGIPEEGIAPGTPWEAIPANWRCPDCGTSKSKFRMVEITAAVAAKAS